MFKKNALIIANSILPIQPILDDCRARADIILCADGGANRARERGLVPDFIVGDLDSILPETRAAFPQAQYIHRPDQNATDLEKTLQFAVEQGVQRALLVGITGLRLDHQICNLNVAEKFCSQIEIELHDDFGLGVFLDAQQQEAIMRFETFVGQQMSLFAFRRAEGIVTEGLKYPLQDEALEWSVRDGLSNEAIDTSVTIRLKQGTLFIYRVREAKSPFQ
ncbi:MAG: thiamine diphosphokinase [candidate division KSB1 bacterium]|nr:thiamine diphosphokinase [candidate division KSB1 bacterium]MDZ7368233.1 thiamine diphosphokinase [candidate division KSB1 bacterium]MDZ7406785.1 thiamine diphosphokinase [candidate division KSB1 bacterium]